MQRYNIFYQVHKGLRALLYDTMMKLQQTDFTNESDAAAVTAQVATVLELFDAHAHTEDNYILPEITAYEPSIVALFENEHVLDLKLSTGLADMLKAFSLCESDEAKKDIGRKLEHAVAAFMNFNLAHMAKEEEVLNKILWRYYTDEQLHEVTMRILAHVDPKLMPSYNKWMMHGLSNSEIKQWLLQVKNNAPDFVFQGMMDLAAAELPIARLSAIQTELSEGAMIAA
ncbi:hemerythrin HHE cation binding domain-containing protein [Lacibacter cauensis]|uniref:Hemerythrin HHE cation binding domain-containing protein n=1 Tax=Lacibacter cauensis TaxID=510947 RepID=A0A562SKJ1_9BACT|nr:hemerythrin domain-containing protein [Lacibacter cauensis]TWI81688.1 hemerythrin HHE cation binding domain-containing protein [Lacibacter cauensis]